MKNYDEIINLPHHISKKHPRLSMLQRAGQFAPFAALTGYGDAIKEASRLTDKKVELDEEEKSEINRKILELKSNIKSKPEVIVTYFIPDARKEGGEYITIDNKLKKIDENNKLMILENNIQIPISDILELL